MRRIRRRNWRLPGSVFWGEAGLLADFVGGDAIQLPMTLDGNHFLTIAVDGMIGALAKEVESVGFEVFHQITPVH